MRKFFVLTTLVALIPAFGSTANAVAVNPVDWTWSLQTSGSPDSWTSDSNLPTDFQQYDYDWQLTQADLLVELLGRQSVLALIPEVDKSKSGTEDHLAFDIFGVANQLKIDLTGIITADILLGVGDDGYGHGYIGNISLGLYGGFSVTSAEFGRNLNVTAVPEPSTLLLLALGVVMLRRKR